VLSNDCPEVKPASISPAPERQVTF
jgi:hypothetical protein